MNNKQYPIVYAFFCLLTFCSFSAEASNFSKFKNIEQLPKVKAQLSGQELTLFLARSRKEKAQGLMFIETLAENHGMLFIYDQPQMMSFWMKNTRIPLDIVFFCERLRVTEWIENMKPGYGKPDNILKTYNSTAPAQYALELNAGAILDLNVQLGDKLIIPITVLHTRQ